MKESSIAIELQDVSLTIPVFGAEHRNLRKVLMNSVTGGRIIHSKAGVNVEALKNLNLLISVGEKVALIGHNGAGKSSFLRLISGIYSPSSGILRLGVAVYPMLQRSFITSEDLSGIDAAKAYYLLFNRKAHGFDEFLDKVKDFSGLGDFLSLPIRGYSEGMASRLMFAILTSRSHECLAIDEGFGTADASFFEKAEARLKDFIDSAGTLILASHSDDLLRKFCNRGLVFRHGSISYDGQLEEALSFYQHHGD